MDCSQPLNRMTESGGVLRVLARDPDDVEQIALIRKHLNHEAKSSLVAITPTRQNCMAWTCLGLPNLAPTPPRLR